MITSLGNAYLGYDNDVASDPFMMLVTPVDHFDTSTGFATANFCGDAKVSIYCALRLPLQVVCIYLRKVRANVKYHEGGRYVFAFR